MQFYVSKIFTPTQYFYSQRFGCYYFQSFYSFKSDCLFKIIDNAYNYIDILLDRHLSLRKGERKKVILLQLNAFLLISILLILKPVFTSNMLSNFGISIMPFAYFLIAMSAVLVHAVVSRLSYNKELITIIKSNHLINILVLLGVGIAMRSNLLAGWTSIVLYVYISLFALVTITYFYQYCQSLLTIRDAKRIYAYIGSGAITGGVFGGYFTSLLVPIVGNSGLIIISAGLLITSGWIMRSLHKQYQEDSYQGERNVSVREGTTGNISALKNNHVLNIAMIIGLGVIVSKLVDYQFNSVALNSISSEDELTSFFGFWFSTINVVGLLLQLFLVSKVIDRVGVTQSIIIMPILLLVGAVAFLIFPVLALAIALKFIEGSLKQSVYKTATEINIMPLSPALRNRAKTLVDVVIDSIATGLAGILIYLIVNQLALPLEFIIALTISLVLLWIFFATRSKKSYTTQLSLMVQGDTQPMVESESLSPQSKKIYIDEIIFNSTSRGKNPKSILLDLINSDDTVIRKSAILRFAKDYRDEAYSTLISCINDPSIQVRKAVYFSLLMIAKSPLEVDNIYTGATDQQFVLITAALAEAIENNKKQKKLYKLYERIDESYNRISLLSHTSLNVKYIGQVYRSITKSRYQQKYHLVREAVKNSMDSQLQKEALRAIGNGHPPKLFDVLIYSDIDEDNRKTFYKALAQYPKRLLFKISSLSSEYPRRLLNYLPALQHVDSQPHINFLFKLLDSQNLKIRRSVLKTINICRRKYPHLEYKKRNNYKRLIREIRTMRELAATKVKIQQSKSESQVVKVKHVLAKIDRGINRQLNASVLHVFIYLAIITQRDDINVIYNAIKSQRKDLALDFLDGILNYRLRKQLLPTLEMVTQKNFDTDTINNLAIKLKPLPKAIKYLDRFPDIKMKAAVKELRSVWKPKQVLK